jgi:choline-sulfatase
MNVILLVVDAWRDDMPWNGYPRDVAPNLHKLWKKSARYERGYAASSFTSKSVPVLLSGQYASSLARTTPFFSRYSQDNDMMPEVLQRAGIRTLGIQAHMYLKEASGLQQGFDVWNMVPNIDWDYNKDPYVTGPDHTKGAIEILSKPENTGKQFFAYFHYMDPHDVYNTHEEAPQWGKKGRDKYDQEIWFTDMWIQKLLDYVEAQPWAKNTAIIVTGDHGEAFGEHNFYKHAFELYEVLVRVPLFVYLPGINPRTIPRWRSAIDLVPTVYDLMGQPIPAGLPGTSLVPELFGEDQPKRPIICDLPADSLNVRHRALIDEEGYKLVEIGHAAKFEMYNVVEDPGETRDLFKQQRARAEAMLERYKKLSQAIPFVAAKGGKPVKKD